MHNIIFHAFLSQHNIGRRFTHTFPAFLSQHKVGRRFTHTYPGISFSAQGRPTVHAYISCISFSAQDRPTVHAYISWHFFLSTRSADGSCIHLLHFFLITRSTNGLRINIQHFSNRKCTYAMGNTFLNENITFLSGCSNVSILSTTESGLVDTGVNNLGDPVTFIKIHAPSAYFCGRISDGSIAASQLDVGRLVTGGMFRRLATAPLIFHVNLRMADGMIFKGTSVCSLTVKWSC